MHQQCFVPVKTGQKFKTQESVGVSADAMLVQVCIMECR